MAHAKFQSARATLGDVLRPALELVADNTSPNVAPKGRKTKSPLQKFNQATRALYGPKPHLMNTPQAKQQLYKLLELVREGNLSCEQTSNVVCIFGDARRYGDLDADLKSAFADCFLDCYEVKFA